MIFLKYLRLFLKHYGRFFWLGIGALAITDILDILPPLIMMKAVDQITGHATTDELLKTALIFCAVTVLTAFMRFYWRMWFGQFHQNTSHYLREALYKKMTELGPAYYAKNPTGELMSLLTADIEAVRMGMGPGILVLVDSLFYFLTIPPIMISLSWSLTWQTLILVPTLPFFVHWLGQIIHHRFLEVQERFSELSGITQENITGIRIVKSYVQEENQIDIFNKASKAWQRASQKVAYPESFMHPVMEFCISVGMVVLLYFGSQKSIAGTLTIGTFVAFQRYISKMTWPMTAMGWGFSLVSQSLASLQRIDEVLNMKLEVNPPTKSDFNLKGVIEIRNLDFNYPGNTHKALSKIDLTILPGETIGIVGPVGAGKSTLAQLLCHFYSVERGKIFFNSHDINDVSLEQLRQHIALVPQETFLFSQTISENMNFGASLLKSEIDLKTFAKTAGIDGEIEMLPLKYQTLLGERGVNLSGGQKQRLAITRALIRESPVIIFDDSLSAVDAETENIILNRLQKKTESQTTIIISHRLSALSFCKRIIVLSEGQIEAVGRAQELLSLSSTYRDLMILQGYA